jgi:hypothetical protein
MPSYFGYLGPAEVGGLVAFIKSLQSAAESANLAPEARPGPGTGDSYRIPQPPESPRTLP